MQEIIQALNWRYATKSFDPAKKLSASQLKGLLSAVQLSPSSFGLQPYCVVVVENPEIKNKLKTAAYEQVQLTEASHIFVFAVEKDYSEKHVNAFAQNVAETRGVSLDDLEGFIGSMNATVNTRTNEQLDAWNAKQAYIALGILLESAALQGIDACPMEGFDVDAFDDILGLKDRNLQSVVMAAVGFRNMADSFQHYSKVRKKEENLFIHIR